MIKKFLKWRRRKMLKRMYLKIYFKYLDRKDVPYDNVLYLADKDFGELYEVLIK